MGTFAAFSLLKELGPVIIALLFAGRAGTALASEIGLMKALKHTMDPRGILNPGRVF